MNYLGHGLDDEGREYYGVMINDTVRFFHCDDESELKGY
jgi:hypothetical protein